MSGIRSVSNFGLEMLNPYPVYAAFEERERENEHHTDQERQPHRI